MINPLNATTEVRNLLVDDEDIKSFVMDKIFPIVAPDDTEGSFIFYQRDGIKTEETKEGISDVTAIVNIGVVSEVYFDSQKIAMAIYKCLVGDYTGTISKIRLQDATESIVDRKYIQILQFTIK